VFVSAGEPPARDQFGNADCREDEHGRAGMDRAQDRAL